MKVLSVEGVGRGNGPTFQNLASKEVMGWEGMVVLARRMRSKRLEEGSRSDTGI